MVKILATCQGCNSKVPTTIELCDGAQAVISNHTLVDPCPNCGATLVVRDGLYTANSYKVNYSSFGSNAASSDPVTQSATFMYGDYVRKLSREFESELERIEANHNFEYGEEFEKAICAILRRVLPGHFGVCRGYVVDPRGNTEGDDVIIYDRMRYPRLRPVEEFDTNTKQRIPIEAVYAYIEAKHTLTLIGASGQSFAKALEQVNNVKALCGTRPPVSWRAINRHITINGTSVYLEPDGPPIRNPFYAAIFARFVRLKDGHRHIESSNVINELRNNRRHIPSPFQNSPDLAVLGSDVMMLPVLPQTSASVDYASPFLVEGAKSIPVACQGNAFGLAMCSLLSALDNIELGRIRWSDVIGEVVTASLSEG